MNEEENHILNTIKTLYFQNSNKPVTVKVLHTNLKDLKPEKVAKALRKLRANSLIYFDEENLLIEPMEKR
jgi:uncharacterized protein (DUF111 family)